MPAGRPSSYTPEIADEILKLLAEGKSLRSIAQLPEMPERCTIGRWRQSDPDFDSKCARAIEGGIDAEVDEMREIEDGVRAGSINAKAGSVVLSSMQWRASKRFSKRYGDRSQVAITDAEGNATGFMFGIIGSPKQIEGK